MEIAPKAFPVKLQLFCPLSLLTVAPVQLRAGSGGLGSMKLFLVMVSCSNAQCVCENRRPVPCVIRGSLWSLYLCGLCGHNCHVTALA